MPRSRRHDRARVNACKEGFSLAHRFLDLGERHAAMTVLRQLDSLLAQPETKTPTQEANAQGGPGYGCLSRLSPVSYGCYLRETSERGVDSVASFLGDCSVFLGNRELRLPLRLQEILLLVLLYPGITTEKLAAELYDDGQIRAVKANVSKLRKHIPISTRVYEVRVTLHLDVHDVRDALTRGDIRTAVALYRGPLLLASSAPGVVKERHVLDESIKRAALASRDPELILALTDTHEEDLEVWEAAQRAITRDDPRRPVIDAQVARIRAEWGLAL